MSITQASLALNQANPNAWIAGNSISTMKLLMNDITLLNAQSAFLAGGNAFTGNQTFAGQIGVGTGILVDPTGVAIATTGAGTLAVVTSGVVAGLITTTSAAAVLLTLDSAAVMLAALGATAGSYWEFFVDNTAGANTVTVAVDSGATVAVITPAITGGATLTVSTANAIAKFGIYFSTATTAKLLRII